MTVLMSRDVPNFPVKVQLFRLLSFTITYVELHQDYLTVESKDVVSCKAFSDVRLCPIVVYIKLFLMNLLVCSVFS